MSLADLPTPVIATVLAAPEPTPLPYNPDDVTPGVVGFLFTFVIFLLVALIALDLLRRIRRMRYRGEVREKLQREMQAANGVEAPDAAGRASADATADSNGHDGGREGDGGRDGPGDGAADDAAGDERGAEGGPADRHEASGGRGDDAER